MFDPIQLPFALTELISPMRRCFSASKNDSAGSCLFMLVAFVFVVSPTQVRAICCCCRWLDLSVQS